MRTHLSKWLLGIAISLNLLISAQAQMAQIPLLTQSTPAEPNLMFVFDDSGSMSADYMYQFGSDPGGMGMASPGGSYAPKSPDVNMMYYNPRTQYQLRVDSLSAPMVAGSLSSTTSFNVYFYNPAGAATKHVSSVTVSSGGTKYSTSAKMTFSAPPAGGVRATGSVSVNSSKVITGITVTNAGSGYTTAPTITITPKTSGKTFKYTVNMTSDAVAVGLNQKWNGTGSVSSASDYFSTGTTPGYLPDAGYATTTGHLVDPGSKLAIGATLISYPNTASSSVADYPKFANRNCTGSTCTWAEELQNYANWKLYHSTRVNLARTGVGLSFKSFPAHDSSGAELPAAFRLGWGTLNRIESLSNLDAGVSLFNQSRKDAFYTWLYGSNTAPSGDTPSRLAMDRVGQYFSRSDSNGPWGTNPSYTSVSTSASTTTSGDTTAIKAGHASCRRSNMMLLTDGYWNGSSSSLGNVDNTAGPTISGTTYKYTPVAPYKDETSNTLADVAMKYWVNDLRTDLANNVPPPIGQTYPTWQNVTFYGIGLGIYGTLAQNSSVLGNLTSGVLDWPVAQANTPTAIDDLWHAAVNTGGAFLNAGDAESLTDSIDEMMASINKQTSSQSGVAVSGAELNVGARKFTPKYTTGSWIGNVTATNLNPLIGSEVSIAWEVVHTDAVTGSILSTIPNDTDRNIVVGNGSTTSPKAVEFTYTAMYAAGLTGLMTGTVDASLINYLRGDDGNEGDSGLGLYRPREALLGDIVNSSPVFVKSSVDLSYDAATSTVPGKSAYRAYVDTKNARTEGVVFVGANDGMLHAFRDGPLNEIIATGDLSIAGTEVFAFVPKAVLPNMSSLARKTYGQSSADPHQFFVDGPLIETDAYLGSAWANVLVGSTGAGAKSVFALQVPVDPWDSAGNSVLGSGNILWELSTSATGFGELGHVISKVQTGVLPSGDWVAIFGNGYFSASGSAQLFVVNLQTGALIQKIDTVTGPGNGLGGVTVVRDESTKRIIGAYAGDLKGNLWKFDLSSTTTGGGFVGLSGVPLMAAGSNQPITAAPALVKHPGGGYVVSVGTGKLFELNDTKTVTQQSIYGVWDSVAFGSVVTPVGVTQTGVTNLVKGQGSVLTQISVDWATKRGWYINLGSSTSVNKGERVVYPVSSLAGTYISVDSMSPNNVSSSACTQSGQGAAWSYVIEVLTGKILPLEHFNVPPDYIPDPLAPPSDPVKSPAGPPIYVWVPPTCPVGTTCSPPPHDPVCGSDGFFHLVRLDGSIDPKALALPCTVPTNGSGVVRRQWRQLFMR